jgi:hypothetical protein
VKQGIAALNNDSPRLTKENYYFYFQIKKRKEKKTKKPKKLQNLTFFNTSASKLLYSKRRILGQLIVSKTTFELAIAKFMLQCYIRGYVRETPQTNLI